MSKRKKIAIFGSGAGSNAEQIISYFKNNELAQVWGVVCNKKQAGILKVAANNNVERVVINSDFKCGEQELLEVLKDAQVDFIVLAGFLRKIPLSLTRAYENRILNIHPSLLPKHGGKGMYGKHVHQAVFDAKEHQSGITIHFVNEEYDEGAIIFQASVDLDANDSPETIEEKVRLLEKKHFPQQIEKTIRNGV